MAPGLGIAGVVTLDGTAWRVALGNVAFMEQNRIVPDAAVLERLASLAEAGQTPLLLALAPARAALAGAGLELILCYLQTESQSLLILLGVETQQGCNELRSPMA